MPFLEGSFYRSVQERMDEMESWANGSGQQHNGLAARVTNLEAGVGNLQTRMGAAEARLNVAVPALPAVSVSPSGGVISVVGVEVATGAAITNLVSAFNSLKNSHNDLIAAAKTWGWMAA